LQAEAAPNSFINQLDIDIFVLSPFFGSQNRHYIVTNWYYTL